MDTGTAVLGEGSLCLFQEKDSLPLRGRLALDSLAWVKEGLGG